MIYTKHDHLFFSNILEGNFSENFDVSRYQNQNLNEYFLSYLTLCIEDNRSIQL